MDESLSLMSSSISIVIIINKPVTVRSLQNHVSHTYCKARSSGSIWVIFSSASVMHAYKGYKHTHTDTHTHTYTHTHMQTYTLRNTHTSMCTHTNTNTHYFHYSVNFSLSPSLTRSLSLSLTQVAIGELQELLSSKDNEIHSLHNRLMARESTLNNNGGKGIDSSVCPSVCLSVYLSVCLSG